MARLLVVGAGLIGGAAAAAALEDGVVDSIAAVVDPDVEARNSLARFHEVPAHASTLELTPAFEGDRALVAFSPRVDEVAPEILRLLSLGYHVVSTCEELAWPSRHTWNAMHTAARTHGKVIIMTGVNPGFLMDRLPLLAASSARKVKSVTVTRRIDSSARRDSFLPKTGRGLTTEEFATAVADGTVGHRGLMHSGKLLAHTLGWPNRDVTETIDPIMDASGTVSGFTQHFTLRTGAQTIDLEIVADWDLDDPGDRIIVDGEPPVEMIIPGGYHGDLGASAQIVTALGRCTELEASFYRPTDLPLRFG